MYLNILYGDPRKRGPVNNNDKFLLININRKLTSNMISIARKFVIRIGAKQSVPLV